VRLLALSGAALIVAFGALYYLEHYRIKNGKNAGLLNATVTDVQDLLT
jgi:hypothetical protein